MHIKIPPSNDYNQKVTQFQKKIAQKLNKKSEKDILFKQFVDVFYSYIPVDYINDNKAELFADFCVEAFGFFKQRPSNEISLDIAQSTFADNKQYFTLKILHDNKPFIIDSVKTLLSRMGIVPKYFFHPTIKVKRNKNGFLSAINQPYSSEYTHVESLLYIRAYGHCNEKILLTLKKELEKLYQKVAETANAIDNILVQLNESAQSIQVRHNIGQNEESYDDPHELYEYLKWLENDNFTFLGFASYSFKDKQIKNPHIINKLGISTLEDAGSEQILTKIINLSSFENYQHKLLINGKITQLSPIRYNSFIDYILVKEFDENNKYIGGVIFLGMYRTALNYQSAANIPIIRKKLEIITAQSGFGVTGYNAKKLREIFESLPRDQLFQVDNQNLYIMCMRFLSSIDTKSLKISFNRDNSGEFYHFIMCIPRDRLTLETQDDINLYLENYFSSKILSSHLSVVAQNFNIIYMLIDGKNIQQQDINIEEIQTNIDNFTILWGESLLQEFSIHYNEFEAPKLVQKYYPIFSKDYQRYYTVKTAINDLQYIKKIHEDQQIKFNFNILDANNFVLKIYHPNQKLSLSEIMPIIENLGFHALEERTFQIHPIPIEYSAHEVSIWIHEFHLCYNGHLDVESDNDLLEKKSNIEDILEKIYKRVIDNDSLCKLAILANLDWLQIKILKALTRYLHQTVFAYGKGYVQLVLLKHYKFTKELLRFFDIRFNPKGSSFKKAKLVLESLNEYLENVTSSAEDKVLRSMLGVFNAVIRTNSFQLNHDGNYKNYISFKFDSSKVPELPLPRPYAEIFVYSNQFEGIHLRGGKVARGGLRWSDRGEDYRTEVLGLMKAQMTKNTVIVPVGSKGGFYIKEDVENIGQGNYRELAVECYKNFLRGLLDLTDNIIDGDVISPQNTICVDDYDPYLVVAADKGTATFSDYANAISAEYNFWLGDAFASGGSAGYDHKKMGITAKGAWIAVKRHFQELSINVQKDPVTVVGIGDMSGDVFGNGMLLSKAIKLVAAFNHMHIFLDPSPDPAKSFKERQRLFKVPRSSWVDYNPQLISEGGGIFRRADKTIPISPEIKSLLNITQSSLAPEELIKAILKAEVDLIWNGGIGTYIKASDETHAEIGDKVNDSLRVNGSEVKARVIGEGGNLGCSQKGRIEYAKFGGKINTDAIDNAAGVNCSDHEVNIKIALFEAVQNQKLSRAQRDDLLEKMTDQVSELVLFDNYKQTQAITISERSSAFTLELFSRLIESLEKEGLLDRAVEFLPSKAELKKMNSNKELLTRPELSVILSYSKMSVYNELLTTKLPEEKFFENYLLDYFPEMMRQKFKGEILNHQLKREIIITVITNKIINQLGGVTIHSLKKDTGAELCDIVRAYTIVNEIFELEDIWAQIENFDMKIDVDAQIDMFSEVNKLVRRGISWFLTNSEHPLDINEIIGKYKSRTTKFTNKIVKYLAGEAKIKYQNKLHHYRSHNAPYALAQNIASLDSMISALDIVFISELTKVSEEIIGEYYFEVGHIFQLDWLRKNCDKLIGDSYWNRLSLQSLKDDFYTKQRRLVQQIVKDNQNISEPDLSKWTAKHKKALQRFENIIAEMKSLDHIEMNIVILAAKKLEIFLQTI